MVIPERLVASQEFGNDIYLYNLAENLVFSQRFACLISSHFVAICALHVSLCLYVTKCALTFDSYISVHTVRRAGALI